MKSRIICQNKNLLASNVRLLAHLKKINALIFAEVGDQ